MVIERVSPPEKRDLDPVGLDCHLLEEVGELVSKVGDFKCYLEGSRNGRFRTSSHKDFTGLYGSTISTKELKFVSMHALGSDTLPILSVEFCHEYVQISYDNESDEATKIARRIVNVCQSRTRKWARIALRPIISYIIAAVVGLAGASAASLLFADSISVRIGWQIASVAVIFAILIRPYCKLALRRAIPYACIYIGPKGERDGFFRRSRDAICVSIISAVVVTLLGIFASLLK
jgi:hypothetical protein